VRSERRSFPGRDFQRRLGDGKLLTVSPDSLNFIPLLILEVFMFVSEPDSSAIPVPLGDSLRGTKSGFRPWS